MSCISSNFAAKSKQMLLKDFFTTFPDEDSCINYFRDVRLSVGVTCQNCGCKEHTWLKGRKCFQCTKCGGRTTLTKGTVMEQSKLPLYCWFFTAHLMTSIKQVLSAKEIQHQLNFKNYPPAWLMMMKYRDIMGQRDAQYKLSRQLEMDISYFPTSITLDENGNMVIVPKKTTVLVMAESKSIDDILDVYFSNVADNDNVNKASKLLEKSKRQNIKKAVNYIKMFAVPNQQFETIKPYILNMVDKDTSVVTDAGKGFLRLKELLQEHELHNEKEEGTEEVVKKYLPWVHIVTGECRSGIEAIHRNIDERFLQLYLNEYCWKFNRRFFRDSNDPKYDLFVHLIRIAASYTSNIKSRDYEKVIDTINIL